MKRTLIIIVSLLALGGLVVWRINQRKQTTAQLAGKGGSRNVLVEVVKAKPATITESLQTTGSLESPFRVQISPLTSGRIQSVLHREGDAVAANEIVAILDPSEADNQIVQAQAALAEAKARLAQAKLGQNSASVNVKGVIEQQSAALRSAKADFDQTKESYAATVATAAATVTDATAKLNAAKSQVANAEAVVNRERASLENSKTRLARITELYNQKFVAAQDLDDAKTAYQVQLAAVQVAESQRAAAMQAVTSANAVLTSATQQKSIIERKGRADITSADARRSQASQSLTIASANSYQSAAYKENLAALQSVVTAAEAALLQARTRKEQTILRSSIAGTVTTRSADPGSLGSPSVPILTIQFLDWLYFNAAFPIETSGRVYAGQAVEIRLDGDSANVIHGTITDVNLAADQQSRQYTVRIRIPNADHRLHPGMFGQVKIVTKVVHADVTVPNEAVTQKGGKATVVVVDKSNKAEVRMVTLGAADDKIRQIADGLEEGESVVTSSYQSIKDGATVKVASDAKKGNKAAKGAKP